MISDKRRNLHVTVPVEVFDALKKHAESTHRSMSQAVVDMIIKECMSKEKENS